MLKTIKQYPLPFFAATGLFIGIVLKMLYPSQLYAHYAWLLTLIAFGTPLILETIKNLFHKKFSVDIIAALAIITALIMNDTFTGAVIVLMQSGGEALEKFGLKRAMFSLDALLARAPKMAIRMHNNQQQSISVQEIQVGDTLLIRPGDMVGADATVIEGEGEIDESAITGEPFARAIKAQSHLFSGSILVNGSVTARADKVSDESQYAKIVQLVEQAHQEKAPIQRLADRYAVIFTPLTLLIAALGFLITQDAQTILAVLVVATPCPLILATPIAVISGINRAAAEGIIVKGGIPLEKIAIVDVAVFDKTGTITQGVPHIEEIMVLNPKYTESDVLYRAALIEQRSNHAVAKAITARARLLFPSLPTIEHLRETPGAGVSGDWQTDHISVGTVDYVAESLPEEARTRFLAQIQHIKQEEKLIAVVAQNNECLGAIIFVDKPKPGVKAMISQLRNLGIKHIIMLTGDNEKNAHRIAQEIGITHFHAQLHPEQKVKEIAQIAKRHPYTVMVGDGINDAPALASAYVGIAMGAQGVAIAAQAADIVLLEEEVGKVANIIRIGQHMLRVAKQGILLGMGLSLILMVVAAFGYIPPPVGAVLQEIIDIAVILNALRARR